MLYYRLTLCVRARMGGCIRASAAGVAKQVTLETEVDPESGKARPKWTSFQLIILSAAQPIGLYFLFTLYKCLPSPPPCSA